MLVDMKLPSLGLIVNPSKLSFSYQTKVLGTGNSGHINNVYLRGTERDRQRQTDSNNGSNL